MFDHPVDEFDHTQGHLTCKRIYEALLGSGDTCRAVTTST